MGSRYRDVLPKCECGHRHKEHPRPFSATGQKYDRHCVADGCHCLVYRMDISKLRAQAQKEGQA
jgi:hypothetical protein